MRVFNEVQRFDQWWFRLLMIIVIASLLVASVFGFRETQPGEPAFWVLLAGVSIGSILAILTVFFMRLETKIDEQGIHYAFRPFHRSFRTLFWHDIKECYVRTYSPIGEFGGWGYRVTFGKGGKAFNVKGNIGLQLIFKNDKRLLIGTQKTHEIKQVLTTYAYRLET